MRFLNKIKWLVFGFFSMAIGLYPLAYFIVDRKFGLLSTKSEVLLSDLVWNIAFYGHIIPGGIALFIGWLQFSAKLRKRNINLHRNIGKVYFLTVMISGLCSLYIGYFSTGGLITSVGFMSMGVLWLVLTWLAIRAVKKGEILQHQKLMIFSYALCFSAVTLRFWLPLLTGFFGDFFIAYKIVAYLSWIPNLIVAYIITQKLPPSPSFSS